MKETSLAKRFHHATSLVVLACALVACGEDGEGSATTNGLVVSGSGGMNAMEGSGGGSEGGGPTSAATTGVSGNPTASGVTNPSTLSGGESDESGPDVSTTGAETTGQVTTGTTEDDSSSIGISESGEPVACSFQVEYDLSDAIGTVGIVSWSTDLPNVTRARIEFGLAETGVSMVAPVALDEPNYRTLLLGMKAARDYVFRIVADAGEQTCTSEEYMLTTDPLPGNVPSIQRQGQGGDQASRGFIVTSNGVAGFGGPGGSGAPVFVFDTDGDVVWWSDGPSGGVGRARMNWEGTHMWMMAVNVIGGMGEVRRVSMDGLDVETIPELNTGHHDFTVLPGDVTVAIVHQGGCSGIVERSPSGQITQIVEDISTIYQPAGDCHPNAILYHPEDGSFTISDRNPNLFVRITREGSLMWQLGGSNPRGNHFPGRWSVNHGHHLLPNGNFLFFNNGSGGAGTSPVIELALDESNWSANEVWRYEGSGSSGTLGDVQRLPNGNTLVTYSNNGDIVEVTPNGMVVQSFSTSSFGYSMFRESLYGAPPR